MTSLANEISVMETEGAMLRNENALQKQHINVLEFEINQNRQAMARLQAERDNLMRRAEAIKALLDQTASLLVSSMRKYHTDERERLEQNDAGSASEPAYIEAPKL